MTYTWENKHGYKEFVIPTEKEYGMGNNIKREICFITHLNSCRNKFYIFSRDNIQSACETMKL